MPHLPKKITCENCLEEFEFETTDIYQSYGCYFIPCFYCDYDVEIYDIEDYGINPKDIPKEEKNDSEPTQELESLDYDEL